LKDSLETVNAEEAERVVEDGLKNLGHVIRFMRGREITGVMKIGESVKYVNHQLISNILELN